jgi:hypothetical protein
MFLIEVIIVSKNKWALKNFIIFLRKMLKKKLFKFVTFFILKQKISICNQYHRKIAILTSPHVYKYAQEHFVIKKYSKKIHLLTLKNLKILVFLKKIILLIFPEINIKIKLITTKLKYKNLITKYLNPELYKIKFLTKFKK